MTVLVAANYLRLRGYRFAPAFLVASLQTARQAARSEGYRGGCLLRAPGGVFWVLTAWDSLAHVTAYRDGGAHGRVMPHTSRWAAAAAVAHWETPDGPLPGWDEAARRMERDGVWLPEPGMTRDPIRPLPRGGAPWRGFLPLAVPRLPPRPPHGAGGLV